MWNDIRKSLIIRALVLRNIRLNSNPMYQTPWAAEWRDYKILIFHRCEVSVKFILTTGITTLSYVVNPDSLSSSSIRASIHRLSTAKSRTEHLDSWHDLSAEKLCSKIFRLKFKLLLFRQIIKLLLFQKVTIASCLFFFCLLFYQKQQQRFKIQLLETDTYLWKIIQIIFYERDIYMFGTIFFSVKCYSVCKESETAL